MERVASATRLSTYHCEGVTKVASPPPPPVGSCQAQDLATAPGALQDNSCSSHALAKHKLLLRRTLL
eukprot:4734053-Lingulodinium_polyedra.AAC.1